VDQAIAHLRGVGITNALVNAGGDLRAIDAVAGGPGASASVGPALPGCSRRSSWVKMKVS
jgi:hypothetical protein